MQEGALSKRGRWWYLRFYESVLIGEEVIRRQRAVKLPARIADYPTEKSVRDARLHIPILAPINAGSSAPESTTPLVEFIEYVYLPHIQQTKKPSTHAGYWDSFKILKPYLGNLELRKVRTVDIQRVLDAVADGKMRANSTFKHFKAFLSAAFTFAIRKGFISINPVYEAEAPDGLPPRTQAYSLAEVKAMQKILPEPARTIVLTLALTGLRVGELTGLRWDDINFDAEELTVNRTVWQGKPGETKTFSSQASIPLPQPVKEALLNHRRRSRGEYVFTGARDGKPIIPDNIKRRVIVPAFQKAGISWRGWHSFRRGTATILKDLAVDDLVISRILRHDDVETTRKLYVKNVHKPARQAMAKLEKAFLAAKGSVLI